jgi:hypothetical protein
MATDPNWDPVDEEIIRILADDPGLTMSLRNFNRAYEAGEAEVAPDDEVRRRLEAQPPPDSATLRLRRLSRLAWRNRAVTRPR